MNNQPVSWTPSNKKVDSSTRVKYPPQASFDLKKNQVLATTLAHLEGNGMSVPPLREDQANSSLRSWFDPGYPGAESSSEDLDHPAVRPHKSSSSRSGAHTLTQSILFQGSRRPRDRRKTQHRQKTSPIATQVEPPPTFRHSKPHSENKNHYDHPFYSRDQVRGAITLSKVRYDYGQNSPSCGPRITCCQSGADIKVNAAQNSHWGPDQPLIGPRHQPTESQPDTRWTLEEQLGLMSPKGNTTKGPSCGHSPPFSALVFCNKPTEGPRVLLINPESTLDWLYHLMCSKDGNGSVTLIPENLLSAEALANKAEVSCVHECHYLMVHEPSITQRGGSLAGHDCRVWTEPSKAKIQAFVCSGGPHQVKDA